MSTTAVGHCPNCAAVINRNWAACLVCHASISPTAETGCTSLAAPVPTIQPGDRITWGAAGKPRGPAVVDFLHVDSDGTVWAFVTLLDSWAAVNTKHVTKTDEGPAKT